MTGPDQLEAASVPVKEGANHERHFKRAMLTLFSTDRKHRPYGEPGRTFEVIGSLYRLWLAHGPRPAGIQWVRLLDVLRPRAGEQLLEVGPGAGYYSLPVARSLQPDGRLTLVDIDQAMLDATIRRLRTRGLGSVSQAYRSDGASLPFEDDSFDGAFLVAVLGEIQDRTAALRELRRVLRSGGRLVVGETTQFDPHALSPARLREEAEAAGFRLDHQIGGRSYLARFRRA